MSTPAGTPDSSGKPQEPPTAAVADGPKATTAAAAVHYPAEKKSWRQKRQDAKAAKAELKKQAADDKKSEENKNTEDGEKKDDAPSKGVLKEFFRVLSYGDKLDYILMFLCFLTAMGSGAAMPLMFLVFGQLTGNFTEYFLPDSAVTYDDFMHSISKNSLYMVYIGIARFVLSYISLFAVRMSGIRISARLRQAYLKKLFQLPVSTIDATSPGAISSRLTTNTNTIQTGISQQLATFVQSMSFTLGLYILSFIKGALLTLVASSTIPLLLLVYAFTVPIIFAADKAANKIREQASGLAFEIFESVRIVNAFGAGDRLAQKHKSYLEEARRGEQKYSWVFGVVISPMFFAMYGSFALCFWFGIKQYIGGHLSGVGDIVILISANRFTVVLFSVNFAVMNMGRLFTPIMAIMKAASAASEIFTTIDTPVPDMSGLSSPDVSPDVDIVFKDVTFTYPTRKDKVILNNLNVVFERGKTTAIVGPSGSGKSTIVGLIQRWYEPTNPDAAESERPVSTQSSEAVKDKETIVKEKTASISSPDSGVFIGGTRLDKIDVKWWRLNVGLVAQEPFLFNDTIFQNVANGLSGTPHANLPKEEQLKMVIAACREAYADDFVARLPEGYDTLVGESGIKISGGQRQRLAIARAIVKEPSVLILDEATSAIDVRTERIVQRALDRASEGRTTIAIAHRLSTIKRADKIVVLRAGELIEQGTHDELVKDPDGVYSALVRAQNLQMGDDEFEQGIQEDDEEQLAKIQTTKSTDERVVSREPDEPVWKPRGTARSFGLLIFEQKHRWVLYTITLLACASAGASQPIQAWIFAKLINVFTLTGDEFVREGNFWALMTFILALGTLVAYFALGWASHIISLAISSFYRQQYLTNLLRKRILFFDADGHSPGTLTSMLSTDATRLQELLGTNMGLAVIAVFNLVGCVAISFSFGAKLAAVGVFTIMPVVVLAGYFRVRFEQEFAELNSSVFAESSQFGAEAVAAFRTVTALLMEDKITTRFDTLVKNHVRDAFNKARFSTIVFALSDSVEMFCQALCFWYGGTLLAKREYDLVTFFVIYMAAVQGSQAAGAWFSFAPNIVDATAAANRIHSARPTKESEEHLELVEPNEKPASVEFRDVSFAYKGRDATILSKLNLSIRPGQFAALVGASGSGKSTCISLLEKFYTLSSGAILIDDRDISTLDTTTLRANLSLVAQESTLYEGTIRENVALSVAPPLATDAAIVTACQAAQIHDFIASLAEGYATRIGPRGVALSGGQRQRLALARALLRKPQVLLLDEATSNLDSESERLVQRAIEAAAGEGGRTVIAVAHRLATVQNADVIFVLGSGRVLESGSHAQLLEKRGVYFQMCQAQALDR